ncbi:MAG: PASTA domain-containing protein, partial [Saccharomonospora viridis]
GHSVTIQIGKTPEMVEVPDMTGESFEKAKATLEGLGLVVKREDVDAEEPQGTVVGQHPNGGHVREGSEVVLKVSNGSQAKIDMPDIVGMTEEEAVSALRNAGWNGTHSLQFQSTSDSDQVGKVLNSSPAPGSSITKNQQIVLYIGADESGSTEPPPDDDDPGFPFGRNGNS